ncbi:uncharacterized protein LOC129773630 [Toxorhynchites rutilus septentrionalis]|uniref:uncharacterized protein LOC129773630 n=1 Tax=Toxorhynchites rutilus septentrionalis TaxID=329112 RepID=UPI0024799977|nr:uncharacterized protein LOC129773630 [Toxorhynchites rutilus septentrionalis]
MSEDPGGGSWAFGSRFGPLLSESEPSHQTKKQKQMNKRGGHRDGSNEIQFTKVMRFEGNNNGPRFLVLERQDGDKSMDKVSPFFIKKAMDTITLNIEISRIQNGCLLLKTVDRQQANKLLKQTRLGESMQIKITEHPTLNLTYGTIYCWDLTRLTDEAIQKELKDAHVVKVERINKFKDMKETPTGKFILTFDLGYLPNAIDVGFYRCRVELYVPNPLRCKDCLRFGHTKKHCRNRNRMCARCGELFHGDNCSSPEKCVNCGKSHSAFDRSCEIFMDEKEIQRIRVTERISVKEARKRRRQQVPQAPVYTRS